jgi:succinate-semialdehyde dehydrogenase/glutarate-semialdehyde dehydrogenase
MARSDLREELHQQVLAAQKHGADILCGGEMVDSNGYFYQPTILDRVEKGNPAYEEELFGPVAIIIRARDEADAIYIANDTAFGLGGSVWTQDAERGEKLARQLECGNAFVNGLVKSDPRLPFGGVKTSGYGRELSYLGIREFVNAKTVWIK